MKPPKWLRWKENKVNTAGARFLACCARFCLAFLSLFFKKPSRDGWSLTQQTHLFEQTCTQWDLWLSSGVFTEQRWSTIPVCLCFPLLVWIDLTLLLALSLQQQRRRRRRQMVAILKMNLELFMLFTAKYSQVKSTHVFCVFPSTLFPKFSLLEKV